MHSHMHIYTNAIALFYLNTVFQGTDYIILKVVNLMLKYRLNNCLKIALAVVVWRGQNLFFLYQYSHFEWLFEYSARLVLPTDAYINVWLSLNVAFMAYR